MNVTEKINMMEKIVRELDDVINSQTSVLKKITQIEAENINLGNSLLDKKLPDIHEHVDKAITEATTLYDEFSELTTEFVQKNKPSEEGPK